MTFSLPWRDSPLPTLAADETLLLRVPSRSHHAWLAASMLVLAVLGQRFVPAIATTWRWLLAGFVLATLALQLLAQVEWVLTDRRLVRTGIFGTRSWPLAQVPTARAVRTPMGGAVRFEDDTGARIGFVRTRDPTRLVELHAQARPAARAIHPPSSP